jgi:cell division protein FtsQ
MRMLVKILLFIPVIYLAGIPVFIASTSGKKPCAGIKIDISDSTDYHFVTKKQLLSLAYGNSTRIAGKPVKDVSIDDIEGRINSLHELKEAEAYMSIDGLVHIFVEQRNPIMRVMPNDGGDYFVDDDGFVMRKRNLYNPRLHIIEGNVNISQAMLDGISVLDTSIKKSILKDIFPLVNYINDDKFWSAQIDQIYIDKNDEIDLIPRAGNHIIHLGSCENYKGKLRNLSAFYDDVLPVVGWNKYSVINLEYKDQVVCKRR